jgi:hypothetical protein
LKAVGFFASWNARQALSPHKCPKVRGPCPEAKPARSSSARASQSVRGSGGADFGRQPLTLGLGPDVPPEPTQRP